jgi:hypothetical protein
MERMGGMRKRGSPFFSYALIPPILLLLPVLALKRNGAMLRCQIKRQNKTDPKVPYKPPSAHEKNISPSLPLRSVGVVTLITSA